MQKNPPIRGIGFVKSRRLGVIHSPFLIIASSNDFPRDQLVAGQLAPKFRTPGPIPILSVNQNRHVAGTNRRYLNCRHLSSTSLTEYLPHGENDFPPTENCFSSVCSTVLEFHCRSGCLTTRRGTECLFLHDHLREVDEQRRIT